MRINNQQLSRAARRALFAIMTLLCCNTASANRVMELDECCHFTVPDGFSVAKQKVGYDKLSGTYKDCAVHLASHYVENFNRFKVMRYFDALCFVLTEENGCTQVGKREESLWSVAEDYICKFYQSSPDGDFIITYTWCSSLNPYCILLAAPDSVTGERVMQELVSGIRMTDGKQGLRNQIHVCRNRGSGLLALLCLISFIIAWGLGLAIGEKNHKTDMKWTGIIFMATSLFVAAVLWGYWYAIVIMIVINAFLVFFGYLIGTLCQTDIKSWLNKRKLKKLKK